METISNPLLRVAPIDSHRRDRARGRRGAGGGQHFRHAAAGAPARTGRALQRPQRDQVSGRPRRRAGRHRGHRRASITNACARCRRTIGPVLGPFESYLTMRGIKTFPLRMERQCANACRVASWLATHPRVERVYFTGDPAASRRRRHPAPVPARVSTAPWSASRCKDAGREEVFRFMDALQMIVRATSLGDVHTMMLYPVMSSHREISPKHRERMGIRDSLVRLRWASRRRKTSSPIWNRRSQLSAADPRDR